MSTMKDMASRPRVLSGIQPSGNLHLGNYLGALRNWVLRQDEFDNFFCVVDLHRLTVPHDPAEQRAKNREVAAIYLAAGIDAERASIFLQSHVPAHSELGWILTCVTPMGWLGRMTQFKDKSADKKESVGTGLFVYPVLMAADIVLYDAKFVPVGDDQKQHIELCRDVVNTFNHRFGEVLTMPEPLISKTGARIMALDDATKKMSKSDENPGASIAILDPPKQIEKKLARATTDSLTEIRFDEDRPGVYNLLSIYEVLTGESRASIEAHFEGRLYGHLKKEVAEKVIEALAPIQARYREIQADPGYLEGVLNRGADRAREVASATLKRVHDAIGIG